MASELRPAVVFNFVFQRPRGSHSRLLPGVSSSSIVVCNFVSIVICIVIFLY